MTAKTRGARAAQRVEWVERDARRRRLWILGGVLGAVAFVAILGFLIYQQAQPAPKPGHDVPIQGRNHIAVGEPHDPYNSEPPSSGPHYDTPAQAGFYDVAPVDEYLVHSMEHGYVIIWYNCEYYTGGNCDQLKAQIKDVMGSAGVSAITGTLKLIAVPRPNQKTVIALSAWGRIDILQSYNRQEIMDFIHAFRDGAYAPEPGVG
jgi:hypothetical protein